MAGVPGPDGLRVLAADPELAVIALDAPAFAQLTRDQRLFAYWLSRAGAAGDSIAYDQSYRHNLAVVRLLRGILAHPQAVPEEALRPIRLFARAVYLNHGMHDAFTEKKLSPGFTPAQLQVAVLAASAAGADFGLPRGASVSALLHELEGPLFDPQQDPIRSDRAPADGKDPLLASAVNLYSGVSLAQAARYPEHYPLNSRLVQSAAGQLTEEVDRAGAPPWRDQPRIPPGLYAAQLERAASALTRAEAYASGPALPAVRELVAFFRTGEPSHLLDQHRAWVAGPLPVDFLLGFIETYLDPRGRKGVWEGLVGAQDPQRSAVVSAVAAAAATFETQAPFDAAFKRTELRATVAEALQPLGGSGDARPLLFGGVDLPNEQAERERIGTKSLIFPAYDDALGAAREAPIERELSPPELAEELLACRSQHRLAFLALHEIVGHASGRVAPALAARHLEPAQLLPRGYNTLEEARADLVAHAAATSPLALSLKLLSARCQQLYPQFVASSWAAYPAAIPQGDRVEQDHLRAQQLQWWWMLKEGAVVSRGPAGHRLAVAPDLGAFRTAAGSLLSQLQRIKSTGDARAWETLSVHADRLDPGYRDELLTRIGALNLPQRVLALTPSLHPVVVDGEVVDARVDPITDLDAQILEDWAGF